MKKQHIRQQPIVIPEPYVECPFTSNANDIKGHLSWTNAVNLSYSSDGASFNGSSSYLRCQNQLKLEKIKTVSYLVKFNRIPTDGVSSTWMALHYFMSYSYYNYASYYSIFQHYSNENVELTNNVRTNSYSAADNTLTTPFGSTLTGMWYRITFRRNSNNTTDLWIDELHKVVNYAIPDSYYSDIVFGKLYPNNIRYLDGNIKDLRIWDVELTDEQIASL